MGKIRILDVTLRDGGCVNDFNFGQLYMEKILLAEEQSGIDVIELGYLDDKAGSEKGRTKFISEKSIYQNFLKSKKSGVTYVAMIDYGKFDVDSLENRCEKGIDGIRLAFHKKDYVKAIKEGKTIIEKGYKLFLQPMITLRYSDRELLDLIDCVNNELPEIEAFYIVDSFGEMRIPDLNRIWNIVDHNLKDYISVGYHSHNNLQLSYSNAMEFIKYTTGRNLYVDSSIMGMGKGAGNLNTELLVQHLNLTAHSTYKMSTLLEVMDQVINQLLGEFHWGYAPEYYLSAINGCSPTYASFFYDKHMLSIDMVNRLLSRISEDKKISFDRIYAEKLYKEFNAEQIVDDKDTIESIRKRIAGRSVLLVAPGQSIKDNFDVIEQYISSKKKICSIGLNILENYDFDYILSTREEIYKALVEIDKEIIVTSNISKDKYEKVHVLNYENWIIERDKVYDSSFVMVMNLLAYCDVKHVLLAGFDGYSTDINANYYDAYLRHPLKSEQVKEYNVFYKNLICEFRNHGMKIEFITDSKYE